MKIFISWSGELSRKLAEILRRWLPYVIHAVEPYFSADDMSKGARWASEIAGELEEAQIGLICLTRQNLEAPWIMFEAGAMSKNLDQSKVCPILFGLEPSDIKGPLVQFQAAKFDKTDIRNVVRMINREFNEQALSQDFIDSVFDKWWPDLEKMVTIELENIEEPATTTRRSDRDLLEEILALSRTLSRPSESVAKELKMLITEMRESEPEPNRTHPKDDDSRIKPEIPAVPVETEEESALAVFDWLTANYVTIRSYRQQDSTDAIFDELAIFLGDRYEHLSRLHELIRRSLSTGINFTLNLSSRSEQEIADCTQFCTRLNYFAFLSSYRYNKYNKTIHASPQRSGNVVSFFSGGWFERFVYLKTLSFLVQNGIEYTSIVQPQITLPNGDDFELDLFLLIDNQPLWLECRTGEHSAYLAKLPNIRKLLSVSKHRAILVILDMSDKQCADLTKMHDITVANENNFLDKICVALGTSINEEFRIPVVPVIKYSSNLLTSLKKSGIRPFPEHRTKVITALISVIDSLEQPTSISDLKQVLAKRLSISKSQLSEILKVIVRGGCLLDENGAKVLLFKDKVSKMISSDPKVIEKKCIEFFASTILAKEPNYFKDPENIREFQNVIGGDIPDLVVDQNHEETDSEEDLSPNISST